MDRLSIGKERSTHIIKFRESAEKDIIYNSSDQINRILGASRYIYDLHFQSVSNPCVITGVWCCGLDPSE